MFWILVIQYNDTEQILENSMLVDRMLIESKVPQLAKQ